MENKEKYKILIPVILFGKAGGFRVLSKLANYWSAMGHDVVFVAYHENKLSYYPIKTNIIWLDDAGKEVIENNENFNARNSGFKRVKSIYQYLKDHSKEYDIVLANQNFSTWPVVFGSKSNNIYYIQAYEPEFYSNIKIKALIQKYLAWLTYYLPLTRVVNADIYRKYKNLRAEYVIPPGLDLNLYYPKKHTKIQNREFVIGCIGRKEEWKGANDVGEAVKILRSKGYKVRFQVAFEPIKYTEYELVKPDGDKNLANFYRGLDVLVAPGHLQLGAVHYPVIEGMACKVPVITTGYYPANNENSFIVPVKRPDLIADKIVEIIEDYENAINKAEKAYAMISQFDWNVISAKFLGIFYDELRRGKK